VEREIGATFAILPHFLFLASSARQLDVPRSGENIIWRNYPNRPRPSSIVHYSSRDSRPQRISIASHNNPFAHDSSRRVGQSMRVPLAFYETRRISYDTISRQRTPASAREQRASRFRRRARVSKVESPPDRTSFEIAPERNRRGKLSLRGCHPKGRERETSEMANRVIESHVRKATDRENGNALGTPECARARARALTRERITRCDFAFHLTPSVNVSRGLLFPRLVSRGAYWPRWITRFREETRRSRATTRKEKAHPPRREGRGGGEGDTISRNCETSSRAIRFRGNYKGHPRRGQRSTSRARAR